MVHLPLLFFKGNTKPGSLHYVFICSLKTIPVLLFLSSTASCHKGDHRDMAASHTWATIGWLADFLFLFSHFSPVGVPKLHLTIPCIALLNSCLAEHSKHAGMDLGDPLFCAQPCLPREQLLRRAQEQRFSGLIRVCGWGAPKEILIQSREYPVCLIYGV